MLFVFYRFRSDMSDTNHLPNKNTMFRLSPRVKGLGAILLWGVFLCIIAVASAVAYKVTANPAWILPFFVWFWLPFVILGIGLIWKPHQAIDNALQLRGQIIKISNLQATNLPVNPHGKLMVFFYRFMGVIFLTFTGLPIVIIFLITVGKI
jgi:hypothetical protein